MHRSPLRVGFSGRRPCRSRFGSTSTLVVVCLVVVAAFVGGAWYFLRGDSKESQDMPILNTVSRAPYDQIVQEQGEVESSNSLEIRCEVKARNSTGTAILEVVPEGTYVEEGDLLVKLDSSALEQELTQQQIIVNTSDAIVIQARNTLEAAQVAREEYLEGTYIQDEQAIMNEVFVAEESLKKAQLAHASIKRLVSKGVLTSLQLEGEQFAVDKARNDLSAAQTKLNVLREFTKRKMLIQFDSDIKTAEVKWENDKKSHEVELAKLSDITDQIEKCTLRAPQAGQVVHANIVSSRGGSEFIVEPGSMVREKQVIIRLPDPQQMQVKAKINEARITLVKPGMPVSLRLDALGGKTLQGEVVRVNQYAEPSSWYSSQVKEYATFIKIYDPPAQIRPGLTAEARIYVEQLPNALQISAQAVYEHKGHTFCLVKNGNSWETRPIEIGSSNEKNVMVRTGLSEHEQVVLNPRSHIEKFAFPDLPDPPSVQVAARRSPAVEAAPDAGLESGEQSLRFNENDTAAFGTQTRGTTPAIQGAAE